MLGVNLLFRLGRRLLAGPLEASGLLPADYYRHRVLEALEGEDFPEALRYLEMALDQGNKESRLLGQVLILRLRLLADAHRGQRQVWDDMGAKTGIEAKRTKYRELLSQEDRALALLAGYEARALKLLEEKAGKAD